MAKLFQTVLFFGAVAVALCHAQPAKLDKIRTTKNRFLARQEVAEEDVPAQTPYPPAGIRPEVPFDLPTEQKLAAPANHYLPPLTDPAMFYSSPAEVYGPPAETYGPPDTNDKDSNGKSIPEVPEEETQTEESRTDEAITEGTETIEELEEERQETSDENNTDTEGPEVEEDNFIPERLVLAKSTSTIKAAKLKQFAPLTRKTTKTQFYLINGSLYTVA